MKCNGSVPLQLGANTVTVDVVDKFFGNPVNTYQITLTRSTVTSDIVDGSIGPDDLSDEAKSGIGPVITVVAGQPFHTVVAGHDKLIDGASASGVKVLNPNTKDGFIQLEGMLTAPGIQVITLDGRAFVFQVIDEPGQSTVTASFE
ncbi:hypothetical protein AB6A23_13865 [Paenibacillus tarimensis]